MLYRDIDRSLVSRAVYHNALDDAKYQAACLKQMLDKEKLELIGNTM